MEGELKKAVAATSSIESALTEAFHSVDKAIVDAGIEKSGSTVVAAFVRGSTAHIANAGDARAVLSRGGKAERVSYDHKASDDAEIKRCEAAGGAFLWGRLQGETMITRALGDANLKPYCISTPFYKAVDIDSSCQFLVLVCDGVTDVFEDQVYSLLLLCWRA